MLVVVEMDGDRRRRRERGDRSASVGLDLNGSTDSTEVSIISSTEDFMASSSGSSSEMLSDEVIRKRYVSSGC